MSMKVSFSNPDIYAQKYASQNGISVDKAKSELKSKYGDPDKNSVFSAQQSDSFTSTTKTPSANAVDADNQAWNYAEHYGVSLSEARDALRNQFGDPTGYDDSASASSNNPFASASGSSNSHPVATDADNQVQNYADHYGVSTAEAREALRNQFGDPTGYEGADRTSSGSSSRTSSSDNNPFARTVEADNEVLTYARMHNCSLDEARAALMGIFGNPQ